MDLRSHTNRAVVIFFFFSFPIRFMPFWWIGELHRGSHISVHLGEMGFPSVQPIIIWLFDRNVTHLRAVSFWLVVNTGESSDGWKMKGNRSSVYDLRPWRSTRAPWRFSSSGLGSECVIRCCKTLRAVLEWKWGVSYFLSLFCSSSVT